MAKYSVEWQMGGEFTFESDRPEDQLSEEIGQELSSIADGVGDNVVSEIIDEPYASADGTAEFTLRKLDGDD